MLKIFEMSALFYYSATVIKKKKYITPLAICLSLGIIIEVLLGVFQIHNQASIGGLFYFLGERFFTSDSPGIANASINNSLFLRPYATLPHPNVLAGYLLLVQLVLLGLLSNLKNRSKKLALIAIAFSLVGILLSLSRIVIILEILLVFYYVSMFIIRRKKTRSKFFYTSLFAAIILISSYLVLPRLLATSLDEAAVWERQALLQESVRLIVLNPITGVGLNNFLNELSLNKDGSTPLQPVHNIPLHIASEVGIPITLLFAFLYITLFRNVWLAKKLIIFQKKEALFLLTVIALLCMVDHYFRTLQQGQLLMAILLGWVYGSVKESSLEKNK